MSDTNLKTLIYLICALIYFYMTAFQIAKERFGLAAFNLLIGAALVFFAFL